MKRLLLAISLLAVMAVLYLIGTPGSAQHRTSTAHRLHAAAPRPPATTTGQRQSTTIARVTPVARPSQRPRPTARTITPPHTHPHARPHTPPVITAPRTDCTWREYRDGALSSDTNCAPGQLDPAVSGHAAQTICNPAWVAAASKPQPPAATLQKLLIEYRLPGPPYAYALARVIPVQDGGSSTSPRNLYPLPLNGWGGLHTQAAVADELHNQICAHKLTVTEAARTLRGDWLTAGLPSD